MQHSFYAAWVGLILVSAIAGARIMTQQRSAHASIHTSAYRSGETLTDLQKDTLLKGQWYLMPILASDTAAGKYPTLTFNTANGTFSGNTGCNRMAGSFKRTDTSLVFNERIMLTKMLCPSYNEAAFIKTLLNTNRYKRDDSVLVLMFNQTELSRWTRKPYKAPMSKST